MPRKCPREGTRVVFEANPAAMMFYRTRGDPRPGEGGSVTSVSLGRGKATCMPGPGGGLVYVDWDSGGTSGVFRTHLRKPSGALVGARRGRR